MYDALMRHVLRHVPSEPAHRMGFGVVRTLGTAPVVGERVAERFAPSDPVLRTRVLGLEFAGPLGLAAGFDKDAEGVLALGRLGFGAVEIGTVTGRAQPGNPRPRLFRLVDDAALVNRMGFNNSGAGTVGPRLAALRARSGPGMPVLGVNIGKSKAVPAEEAASDYRASAAALGASAKREEVTFLPVVDGARVVPAGELPRTGPAGQHVVVARGQAHHSLSWLTRT